MTEVTIRLEATPTTDIYERRHVLSVDKEQPNTPPDWSNTVWVTTAHAITKEITVDLGEGAHFVEYAVSGYVPDHAWHARIYVDGELMAEGDVGRRTHLRADFQVEVPKPSIAKWLVPLGVIGGIVGLTLISRKS